mgnify:FL=1
MSDVRVGVIGIGYWGPNVLRNFAALPGVEVVAVADRDDRRLREVRDAYPHIAVTKDYADFVRLGVDAVAIATPPATHFPIARDCLEYGLHVLVEKPLALNVRDAELLVDLAERRGLTLMVGHTFEYNPAVRRVKQLIDSGVLGKIHYIDSSRVNLGIFQNSVNVIWDLAPHDISILLYLLGMEPLTVSAEGNASIFEDVHDIAHIHMKFPGNTLAHVHVSWLSPTKTRRMVIVGSEKMLVYDDIADEKVRLYDRQAMPLAGAAPGEIRCHYRYGDSVALPVDWVEPLRLECEHYIESIRQGTPPQSDGYSGLRVVRVLERADESLYNSEKRLQALMVEEARSPNGTGQGDSYSRRAEII